MILRRWAVFDVSQPYGAHKRARARKNVDADDGDRDSSHNVKTL